MSIGVINSCLPAYWAQLFELKWKRWAFKNIIVSSMKVKEAEMKIQAVGSTKQQSNAHIYMYMRLN